MSLSVPPPSQFHILTMETRPSDDSIMFRLVANTNYGVEFNSSSIFFHFQMRDHFLGPGGLSERRKLHDGDVTRYFIVDIIVQYLSRYIPVELIE